jgi:hypothetical protein
MSDKRKRNMQRKRSKPDTFNLDKLLVDIAACDDLEIAKYYKNMLTYLAELAKLRIANLEFSGFGIELAGVFIKQFPTMDEAHNHVLIKIMAIHDCAEDDIRWQDYNALGEFGISRAYWVGERPFFGIGDSVASIKTVDAKGETIWVFAHNKLVTIPNQLTAYETENEKESQLSHLIQENIQHKNTIHSWRYQLREIYDGLRWIETIQELTKWIEDNTYYLSLDEDD